MKKLIYMALLGVVTGMLYGQDDPFVERKSSEPQHHPENLQKQKGPSKGGFRQEFGLIERLKSTNPEKYEELKKLREENPEAFREKIKEIVNEMREKFQAERREIDALVAKYKETGSEEDKNALKEKIKEQILKYIQQGKERIAEMEKNLQKFKNQIEETEKNLDAKIEERIEKMLNKTEENKEKEKKNKGNTL